MNIKKLSSLTAISVLTLAATPALAETDASSKVAFACEVNNGVPTTVLQAEDGEKTTFFNWDSELPSNRTPVELCKQVSDKLNAYTADESNDLSALTFKTDTMLSNIPAVDATDGNSESDELVLFTLSPSDNARQVAINVLDDIVDKDLQTDRVVSPARGLQSVTHSVNIWELILGRKLMKTF